MLSHFARAEIAWERTMIHHQAAVGEEAFAFDFAFSNRGPKAVTFTRIKPDCGCTVAELDKFTYAPGESGTLHVTFDGEGLIGTQEKSIQVTADDKPATTTMLTLRVTLTFWSKFEPALLTWPVRREPVEQSAVLVLLGTEPLRVIELTPSDATFTAQLKPTSDPRKFVVTVQPGSTAQAHDATIRVKLQSPTLAARTELLVVRVR